MRIGSIVFLLVTLVSWHPVVSRPAGEGVALWNTCSSDGPCSATDGSTHTTSDISPTTPPTSSSTATPTGDPGSSGSSSDGGNGSGDTPSNSSSLPPQSTLSPISENPNDTYGDDHITIQLGVTGGILIALGMDLMILGFRSFRPTLAVTGFLEFGLVAWIGLINAKPAHGYVNDAVTMIAVPAGVGVLGAILYAYFWFISYYLVGAMGGFTFGMFILLWREDLVIVNDIGRYCFLGGLALVYAGLTRFVERHVILKSTSFTGAFLFIVGVDCLAHVGYLSGIIKLLDRNTHHPQVAYHIDGRIYGMMVGIILLFIVSFGWQFFFNLGRRFGVNGGILTRALHHNHHEEGSGGGSGGGSPRSSGEHQARSEHHSNHNLVEDVVHHVEEILEQRANHRQGSHHS